jgi:hypothetical protein
MRRKKGEGENGLGRSRSVNVFCEMLRFHALLEVVS